MAVSFFWGWRQKSQVENTGRCGSWLACDGGTSVVRGGDCKDAIAGKPAPTFGPCRPYHPVYKDPHVVR
ncbi:hypothetical protein PflCFBP13510_22775 [Pseudomonas fluorescens]|nr:hypothetical protein PflCFBP13510_22775 [Pseudomonas fluorescens]